MGGAESFLDSFSNINLALMYQQHEAIGAVSVLKTMSTRRFV